MEINPVVGLSPNTPHIDDGIRIEPPVSVPIPSGANPAATATTDVAFQTAINRTLLDGADHTVTIALTGGSLSPVGRTARLERPRRR